MQGCASSFLGAQAMEQAIFAHGHQLEYKIGQLPKAFKELKEKFLGWCLVYVLRARNQSIRKREKSSEVKIIPYLLCTSWFM